MTTSDKDNLGSRTPAGPVLLGVPPARPRPRPRAGPTTRVTARPAPRPQPPGTVLRAPRRADRPRPIQPGPIHPVASRHDPVGAAGRDGLAWETRYVRVLLLGDLVVACVAGALAFGARFGGQVTRYNRGYLALTLVLALGFMLSLALNRAYEKRFLFVGTDEYQRVLRAGMALTATTAVTAYALNIRLARGYVALALPLATLACIGLRFLIRKQLHRARGRGACQRRVIVVGHELAVVAITRQLRRERYHGLQVVGCCLPPPDDLDLGPRGALRRTSPDGAPRRTTPDGAPRRTTFDGVTPVYGSFDEVAGGVHSARADTVLVLSCPELDGHTLRRLAWRLERDEVDLIVASSLIDVAGTRTTIRPVDGLPMLHVEHPNLAGSARIVKAVLDRCAGVALLVLLAPLLAAVAGAVRWRSPGPVLFRQVRVGKDGREFVMYKFRTMHPDAPQRLAELRHRNEYDGVLFKMRDDPRVTPVGRWLRRFSVDEIPQLVNVLLGQMSLVGPRPPLPEEVAVYHDDVRRRLAVKPGLTGLWQVSGRSDLPWEEAVKLDLRYVDNWSFLLDVVILLRTLSAVCRSSGAY